MDRNRFTSAALGSAKMSVNGELTVTNLIPLCQPPTDFRVVTEGSVISDVHSAKLPSAATHKRRFLVEAPDPYRRQFWVNRGVIVMPCQRAKRR